MLDSILDNDLYKFTMQQAVVVLYPHVQVRYEFIDRCQTGRFNAAFFDALRQAVAALAGLQLRPDELRFLRARCPYLMPAYIEYLKNYRFDPAEVNLVLEDDNRLSIHIEGPWRHAILWEVPLLALVSELHGKHVDRGWSDQRQAERLEAKSRVLAEAGCRFADFGTRRRRDFESQRRAVEILRNNPGFLGTSNLQLAHVYNVNPVGTMAHEWIMAHSVRHGLRHANRFALEAWSQFYRGQLGIALTDTYTSGAFFADFDGYLARLYDGVRQDSGSPFDFTEMALDHYRRLGIDPTTKTIIFSDGLYPELAAELQEHCRARIRCAFGIGTNLTNDYPGHEPLGIVIKLTEVDGLPVVKLTDDPAKATGEPEALRVARWTFLGTPLDTA